MRSVSVLKFKLILQIAFIQVVFSLSVLFGDTVPQTTTLSFAVQSINALDISGSVGTLLLSSATPGVANFSITEEGTFYSYTTNDTTTKKIIGSLDSNMPSSTTLKVELEVTAPATSLGMVTLSTTPANLVTGIPGLTLGGPFGITYQFIATTSAGTTSFSRMVTLTLTDQ